MPKSQLVFDAALIFGLLLFCFSPPWHIFSAWSRVPELGQTVEVRRAVALLEQVEQPLAPIKDPIHRILQWRLLFPVTAHVLHLPPAVLLALPHVGVGVALYALLYFARREGVDRKVAVGGAVLLGATGWYFASTGWLGYFDSWLVVAMLFVSHGRPARWVWVLCALAPWIDERFIIALPLALLIRWLRARGAATPEKTSKADAPLRVIIGAAIIGAIYVAIRLSLGAGGESLGLVQYLGQQQTFQIGIGRHLLGLWAGLRFGWLLVGVAAVLIWRIHPPRLGAMLVGMLIATVAVSMMIANDLSRSTSVLVPLALEGLVLAASRGLAPFKLIGPLALAALLVPASHVVTDFTLPIERLPAVLHARAHPSGTLHAINWVKRAEELVAQEDRAAAERHLDVALRLDANCGAAYNVRGFLASQDAQWQAAFAHFVRACQLTPTEPSFWLHQAYAAWKLSDTAAYARAIAEAKRLAVASSDVATKIAALENLVNGR